MKTRAGYSRINLSGELQYKSFVPAPLPPNPPLEVDEELCVKLSEANRLIGILTGGEGSRRRIYQYKAYLEVLRQGTENY